MLRLNMTIAPNASPNRLGVLAGDVAGFPNGRRLGDDVVDIAERVVAGVLVPGFNIAPNNQLGDGIDVNDVPYLPYFPYVAPPHNPFIHSHHPEQHGVSPKSLGPDPVPMGAVEGAAETESAGETGDAAVAKLGFAGANPASQSALEFTVAKAARVSLKIYDVAGREVRTLVDQDAAPGTFRALWDGRTESGASAGNGVYFARFTADNQMVASRKIVLQ